MSNGEISTLQRLVNANLNNRITEQIKTQNINLENQALSDLELNKSREEANKSKEDVEFWRDSANIAKRKVKNLEEEVNFYKGLLAKPMIEIANQNENFKETYKLQQELLADWMVRQRAFKELAIDFGIQLGKNKEEIIKEGIDNENKVFENKTKHGNNLDSLGDYKGYAEQVKNKRNK